MATEVSVHGVTKTNDQNSDYLCRHHERDFLVQFDFLNVSRTKTKLPIRLAPN